MSLPNIDPAEIMFLQNITKEMSDDDKKKFFLIYQSRRRDPQMMLLLTLLGFVGVAGIHRMMQGELGLGIVYLFTAGLCFIGTIIDIFNYKKLVNDYNQRVAAECLQMMKMF
ncbi:MAG TPA: TM2 domain-containing protein [Bacteroidales bacterium]|nr:TM2 domain-containing protein [Bacteroidales bacterium]HSA43085.1 TM2 domain-containing protein [Bacteroidales bacterium]